MKTRYIPEAPQRAEIDASKGPLLLEFGANWCGHCMAAQPPLEQAFAGGESVTHYKVEDGPGRPLGRSFRVKLWPTFIFLLDGEEKARVVRPLRAEDLSVGFAQIDP
ncbi:MULTISPECIES: thioredoxin family protein [Duganella]|jgi:thioredoxin 1|uniref:Thioredoxin family protein n=2 Tax=Duganella TaxID=75654 RepID=A0ABX6M664_9BURK|nr:MULTISPECIES: thioredoxin family protein [Duganella]MYN28035.1 thioredoxin [Duganella levis]QJD89771.1 thioredoxin family protein [Duganella dendranthematis]